jgi:Protein of unknown function (DUF1194)
LTEAAAAVRIAETPSFRRHWLRGLRQGAIMAASKRLPAVFLAAMAICGLLPPAAARAADDVDLLLVLAADVSRSIDHREFALQREGYAAAISSPRVLRAIGAGIYGAIAITFIEWAGAGEQNTVVRWTIVRDAAGAATVAATLRQAGRSFAGRTSISGGIDAAMAALAASGVAPRRRVIDVSGDGTNNSGRPVQEARAAALAKGVTINGLAIINPNPMPWFPQHTHPPGGLPDYYRRNVVGGPGAFLLVVKDFDSFRDAMIDKLVSEISARRPPARLAWSPATRTGAAPPLAIGWAAADSDRP